MNVLIVDDEPISVDGLVDMIHWESLGISEVLTAYSMKGAQRIFEEKPVDIMISDIEMPGGSGIDLMKWVCDGNYPTLCIFLTSFSKFEYASEAVRLHIFEYVLKPVEYDRLEEVLGRAIRRVQEEQAAKLRQTQGEYWQDNQGLVLQHFWRDLIAGKIASDPSSLAIELDKKHISRDVLSNDYRVIYLKCVPAEDSSQWPSDLWSFTINNVLEEAFPGAMVVGDQGQDTWIIADAQMISREEAAQGGDAAVKVLSRMLPADLMFFGSPACHPEELHTVCRSLLREARHWYSVEGMFLWTDIPYRVASLPSQFSEGWNDALLHGNTDLILEKMASFFDSTRGSVIHRELVEELYRQLLSSVFYCLNFYRIPIGTIQLEPAESTGHDQIMSSVSSFEIWAQTLLDSVAGLILDYQHTSPVIDTVCKYIQDNLNEDLNRTVLAGQVHMNPDYLSTLFRQKMGCSLVEYITQVRIEESKKLLLTTDLPVASIAARTGFQNIPYFSKQFKRLENQTPFQYRKQNSRNQ